MSTIEQLDAEVDSIAAHFEADAQCGIRKCSNSASWHIDQHGCKRGIICDPCWSQWLLRARLVEALYGEVICPHCKRHFASVSASVSVRAI